MKKVVIIIPLYKPHLNEYEIISVSQTCNVLNRYPIVIVHPEGMDTSTLSSLFKNVSFHAFPEEYFAGIMGYNRLMLSTDFYEAFMDYEYMLICQSDAYIFRDELEEWCDKGYSYIGAPWLRRKVYDFPILKQCMQLSLWYKHKKGKRSKQDLYNKIGNGGLSLRRVRSFYNFLSNNKQLVALYTNRKKKYHLFNEDVFWALEPNNFSYSPVSEALTFAFDKYPKYSYKLTGGKLPFGCHAWYKHKMKSFWMPIIGFN